MIRRSILPFFLFIPVIFTLISCLPTTSWRADPTNTVSDPGGRKLEVPFFPQEKDQCGPASLASVLGFHGIDVTPEDISREIYIPEIKGTLNIDLLFYARSKGLDADAYRGSIADLKKQITEERPLLLFLNLGLKIFPAGHYIVVTGFDEKENIIYAHSGVERNKPIPLSELMRAWEKGDFWTLLIRPKK